MKICTRCNVEKTLECFSKKKQNKDGLQYICKACQSLIIKEHYKNNKQYYVNKAAIVNARRKPEALQFLIDYLKKNPCIDCNEKDPIVLQFDHVRGKKIKAVSEMAQNGYSNKALMEEIEKCEVRCANCHMRKTAKQFGWYQKVKL